MLGVDFEIVGAMQLYRASDALVKHREAIEAHLFDRAMGLFDLQPTVTLYDLTNTYFEGGASEQPQAQRGHSKEKRSDCPLLTLGLMLDASGFVRRSKVFAGNVREQRTLAGMLEALEAPPGALVVMDRGVATEACVQWLRDHDYRYLVVSRERHRQFDAEAAVSLRTRSNQTVHMHKVVSTDPDEVRLYCYSEERATESLEQPPDRVADGRENDQKQEPSVATEATQADSQTTPAEAAETPQHDSNTSPVVATESLGQEGPEQPEQPPDRVADGRENDQKQEPSMATEATQTDSQTTPAEVAEPPQHDPNTSPIVAAQDTAQMTPIPGWKPRKLNAGEWAAALEGEMVTELPDDNQLPGTPIVVTDKRGESWTTTLTEVVDRTDNAIVVKNSGRPRS